MYLKAIELHGFKSFPEKTKIEFEKGMSVVVGPNGSGKSNISDAIRWVLGETRSSQLRGSGKMEDIIFGGTQKRSPMGFASVSLILDNREHIFDVDSDEVTVMRKYYRGGDSEYYINGARVRLRDIQELFMDTGLGRNGYSIVGQGKVNEIVTSKPEGRREIFEEASGIAKFRYKKNEAEKKLESAQININRVSDILAQLEERIGPLERESIKAKDFLNLSEKKREVEISLWMDTVDKSKELIRTQQRRVEIFNEDLDRISRQLEEKEKYLEERYLYSNMLMAKRDENIAWIRETEGIMADFASRKAVLENSKSFADGRVADLQKELADFENRGEADSSRIAVLNEKIARINRQITDKFTQQSALQIKLDELAKKAEQSGDEKGKITAQINSLNIELQQHKIDFATIDSQSDTAKESMALAADNMEKAKEFAANSKRQADDVKEFIDLTTENIIKTGNIKNGLMMKKNSALAKLQLALQQTEENNAHQNKISERIRILTELENSMGGLNNSVKAVLKKAKEGGLGGILGSVAQLITVESGYETAVEIALGRQLQYIIVENESSARRGIEFLKATKEGRATFLPVDTVKPSQFNEKLPEGARTADSVITADSRFKNIISNLLGRTIFVEDMNSASSLAKRLNYRYRIVTLDGQVINAGGSFTGGFVSKSAGLLTRKTEIENLKIRLAKLKNDFTELDKNRLSAQDRMDNINSSIEGCDGEIANLSAEKNEAEIEYARLYRLYSQYETSVETLEADIENHTKLIKNNLDRKILLEQRSARCEKELVTLSAIIESIGRQDEESVKEQNSITARINDIKLEIAQLQGSITLEENNLNRLQENLADKEQRKARVISDIASIMEENDIRNSEIKEIEAKTTGFKLSIQRKEQENADFVQARLEIEEERTKITNDNRALFDEKSSLTAQIATTEERIKTMETESDSIIAKLWEEYELTVQTAREFCTPIEDEAEMKRRLNGIKNAIRRLGSVNVGAIEEYKEISERYTYMKTQLGDLNESKNQLVKLITSLSVEMKIMFSESFDIINKNFGRIFSELFGGGNARLELTDKEDVLSSGIEIIVSPPGKVIKSLTALSGGEQALVAIALYFAILAHNPSPFCVLDEIEAALDDVNVARYANYLHRICDKTQFIVITHRRGTMDAADVLYGVTMQEDGISKLLKLDINNLSPSILN